MMITTSMIMMIMMMMMTMIMMSTIMIIIVMIIMTGQVTIADRPNQSHCSVKVVLWSITSGLTCLVFWSIGWDKDLFYGISIKHLCNDQTMFQKYIPHLSWKDLTLCSRIRQHSQSPGRKVENSILTWKNIVIHSLASWGGKVTTTVTQKIEWFQNCSTKSIARFPSYIISML